MRFKNLFFPLAAVFLAVLPVAGWPQETTTTTPIKTPTLRFDGVYETKRATRTDNDYYRFFADGKVVESYGQSAEKAAPFLTETYRWHGGAYATQGSRIEITFGARKLIGGIEQDRIKIEEERYPKRSTSVREEWVFIPFDFAEFERKREAALEAQRARDRAAIQLAMGTVVMDERCEKVDFTPAKEPMESPPSTGNSLAHRLKNLNRANELIQFPTGTVELAYQVSSIPEGEEVTVNLGGICGTRGFKTARCNKYSIVMGRPVNTGWTTVVRCGDGRPFEAGAYKLQLISGERLAKEIAFEIK